MKLNPKQLAVSAALLTLLAAGAALPATAASPISAPAAITFRGAPSPPRAWRPAIMPPP